MLEIITLLFDEYTKNLPASQAGPKPEHGEARYQQLRELVGDDTALDIWDAAVAKGAVKQEVYFQAGLKTGMILAKELLSL